MTDAELKAHIRRIYKENFSVYGADKVWRQLHREAIACGRDRVARLMGELGLKGATRKKPPQTTTLAKDRQPLPADLVNRDFKVKEPNQLWVNDLTYVPIASGFAYTAFVTDACSQRILGWTVSGSLCTDLALDALEMAIWTRQGESLEGLVHHSDRGSQGSTWPSATRPDWRRPASCPRSAPRAIRSQMHWPRRLTDCTRPS